jgi:hypothetical protein
MTLDLNQDEASVAVVVHDDGDAAASEEEDDFEMDEAAGEKQQQEQQQHAMSKGWEPSWAQHSKCGKWFNPHAYEVVQGGRKGQKPSPVWYFCVKEKATGRPFCLIDRAFHGSSLLPHNVLVHLRKHKEFRAIGAGSSNNTSKKTGGAKGEKFGLCEHHGKNGSSTTSRNEWQAEAIRLMAAFMDPQERFVACVTIWGG